MPNWTSNTIRLEGDPDQIREVLERVRGPTPEQALDFNRIIPMPQLLRHTAKGRRTFDGRDYESWYVINPDLGWGDDGHDQNERPFTPDEEAALRDIGYSDWYDWSVANWGTKWNACGVRIDEPGEGSACEIRFDTAWAAPFPVFQKLAVLFPQIAFTFTWTDEDEPEITHSLKIHHGASPNDSTDDNPNENGRVR